MVLEVLLPSSDHVAYSSPPLPIILPRRAALLNAGLTAPFAVLTAENPQGDSAEEQPTPAETEREERRNEQRNSTANGSGFVLGYWRGRRSLYHLPSRCGRALRPTRATPAWLRTRGAMRLHRRESASITCNALRHQRYASSTYAEICSDRLRAHRTPAPRNPAANMLAKRAHASAVTIPKNTRDLLRSLIAMAVPARAFAGALLERRSCSDRSDLVGECGRRQGVEHFAAFDVTTPGHRNAQG
jgi:hypothetical protein